MLCSRSQLSWPLLLILVTVACQVGAPAGDDDGSSDDAPDAGETPDATPEATPPPPPPPLWVELTGPVMQDADLLNRGPSKIRFPASSPSKVT